MAWLRVSPVGGHTVLCQRRSNKNRSHPTCWEFWGPPDPYRYVFGPPGSRSVSQRYGSGFGSFRSALTSARLLRVLRLGRRRTSLKSNLTSYTMLGIVKSALYLSEKNLLFLNKKFQCRHGKFRQAYVITVKIGK
jgi:hypothetical protein